MDELARAAKADPVEFRLRHLADARAQDVIRTRGRALRLGRRGSAGTGRGRGFAFARYKNLGAYAAIALRGRGRARHRRRAHRARGRGGRQRRGRQPRRHPQPDRGRHRPVGELDAVRGGDASTATRITSRDWSSYPILRFPQVPDRVDVHVIDRPGPAVPRHRRGGAGPDGGGDRQCDRRRHRACACARSRSGRGACALRSRRRRKVRRPDPAPGRRRRQPEPAPERCRRCRDGRRLDMRSARTSRRRRGDERRWTSGGRRERGDERIRPAGAGAAAARRRRPPGATAASIATSPPTRVAIGTPSRYSTREPADARHLRPGHERAEQVERIGARRGRPSAPSARLAAHLAQRRDRLGQRELLARETGDEAPAADLAARLQPPAARAPGRATAAARPPRARAGARRPRRSGAAACARRARRRRARARVARACAAAAGRMQRPAPRVLDAEQRAAPPRSRRADARFDGGTSSARRPAKLSELDAARATSSASASSTSAGSRRVASTISSKNDAPCARRCSATRCGARRRARSSSPRRRRERGPRRGAARAAAARSASRAASRRPRALRRRCAGGRSRVHTARPAGTVVEPRDRVVVDARRQQLGFPRGAGASKPSSCASTPASASGPLSALAGADVLPLEQEAHEVARLDRLDLAAQALDV